MRVSIVIASHNEGDLLRKTVASCLDTTEGLDYEIVIADDASTDGCIEALQDLLAERRRRGDRLPQVRLVANPVRRGVSFTKDLAGRTACGAVLLFLDGHCKPQRGAVRRLVEDVEKLEGRHLVSPRIPGLDPVAWKWQRSAVGYGFCMDLLNFECAWIARERMARRGRYYESPAAIGCCLTMSRNLYQELGGFDVGMTEWGIEDIDFGMKAWLLGHDTLVDTGAAIGHRFRLKFDNYTVTEKCVLANKVRMARKNFSDSVFAVWVEYNRSVEPGDVWASAWKLYEEGEECETNSTTPSASASRGRSGTPAPGQGVNTRT
jgi:GT2 family glycosyltransferase